MYSGEPKIAIYAVGCDMPTLSVLTDTSDHNLIRYKFSKAGELEKIWRPFYRTDPDYFYLYEYDIKLEFPKRLEAFSEPYTQIAEFGGKRLVLFCWGECPAPDVYSLVFTTYFLSFTAKPPPKRKMAKEAKEIDGGKHVPHPILKPEREYTVTFDLPAQSVLVSEQGGAPNVIQPNEYSKYFGTDVVDHYFSIYFPGLREKLPLFHGGYNLAAQFQAIAVFKNWRVLKDANEKINAFLWKEMLFNQCNPGGETVWEILGIDQIFFSDKWEPVTSSMISRVSKYAMLQWITETRRKDISEILDTWERLANLCGGVWKNSYTFPEYLNIYLLHPDRSPQKVYADICFELKNPANSLDKAVSEQRYN